MATSHNLLPAPSRTSPRCANCTCSACRPPRRPVDCGLVQLELSYACRTRKRLRAWIHTAELPHTEFARVILGVDDPTIWRYLAGKPIPRTKAEQINAIEHVERSGGYTTVVYRNRQSPHWTHMAFRRAYPEGFAATLRETDGQSHRLAAPRPGAAIHAEIPVETAYAGI